MSAEATTFSLQGPLPEGISLLEASAGTGKTYTIATLFLRLITEAELSVDEILVVTYTNAATSELTDRIRLRLRDAAKALDTARDPDAAPSSDPFFAWMVEQAKAQDVLNLWRDRARRACESLDEATISTIHGFCQRMLRQNAFESGAPFDTELVQDLSGLLDEVVRDFWTRATVDASEAFLRWLDGHKIGLDRCRKLARAVAADPDAKLIPARPETANDGAPEAKTRGFIDALKGAQAAWGEGAQAAVGLLLAAVDFKKAADKQLDGRKYRAATTEKKAQAVAQWLKNAAGPGSLPKELAHFGQRTIDAAAREGAPGPCHPLFDAIDALVDAEQSLSESMEAAALTLHHDLADYIREELVQRKATRHQQSFDDLLRQLRDGLVNEESGPALGNAIRAQFQAALIDEFQDTDPVQWTIFERLFGRGHGRLVLVGDPKQAIYGFRGADIFAYLDARRSAQQTFTLGTNHRSDGLMVAAFNHLFGRDDLTDPFLHPDINYLNVDARHGLSRLTSASNPRPALDIAVLNREDDLVWTSRNVISKSKGESALPARIAAEIAATLNEGATIDRDGCEMPVGPKDIAVLVRSNRQAAKMREALEAVGVPAVLRAADSVMKSVEATELERLLAGIADPGAEGRVRAALATDLAGLPAEELADLEQNPEGWERWLMRLRNWRDLWTGRGFIQMFRAVARDLQWPERILAAQGGERRMTNLLHLAEILHTAVVQNDLEPAGVLAWIVRARDGDHEDAESRQLRLERDDDAVSLVTVHRAKGLEYPLVWCPFLWQPARVPEGADILSFHDHSDGEQTILDVGLNPKSESRRRSAEARVQEDQAELVRLAYVAITRACHRCTLVWGAFDRAQDSALGRLLGFEGQALSKLPDEAILESLQKLCQSAPLGALGVRVLGPADPAVRYTPPATVRYELSVRQWTRATPLDALFRRASFSQMIRHGFAEGAHHDAPAQDHDALPDTPTGAEDDLAQRLAETLDGPLDGTGAQTVTMAEFPRGAQAGTCLHAIFEHHDFQAPDALNGQVQTALRGHGFDAERWSETVSVGLDEVLRTRLNIDAEGAASGPCLADIPRVDRLDEMDFDLPVQPAQGTVRAITPEALADVFRHHAERPVVKRYAEDIARLAFVPVRGFLTGSIDLVFRWASESGHRRPAYWLVDYKSNFLGTRVGDYGQEALDEAMLHGHYILQYHLYTLALHRFLRLRQPGYTYDAHLGGVRYLFIRGMTPDSPSDTGVFRDVPPLALIDALDELFGGPGAS